jgi:hypothetical protein
MKKVNKEFSELAVKTNWTKEMMDELNTLLQEEVK